jgi:hypothetical protein
MDLPRRKNQHCEACGHGPNYAYQLKGGIHCAQNIRRALWDGVNNTCNFFQYVPGTDAEVDGNGSLIDQ